MRRLVATQTLWRTRQWWARAALTASLFLASIGAAAQLAIVPPSPKPQETVRLRVADGILGFPAVNIPPYNTYNTRATRVSMAGNKVSVSVELFNNEFGSPAASMDLPLGQFPAGSYEVEVSRRLPDGTSAGVVGTTTFAVSPRTTPEPLWNHTDMWWNPSESGWGLNIVQHGSGIIFATWFVYGQDGRSTWYVVPEGQWRTPSEYRGPLYRTTGPYFGGQFNPQLVSVTLVGSATLTFSEQDSNLASASFVIDGVTIFKFLRRQSF